MIRYGDFVRTVTHGHEGRVYNIEYKTSANEQAWMDMQAVPLTPEQRREPFVHILVHPGGACCAPMSLVETIPPIKGFKNSAKHPFPQDTPPYTPGPWTVGGHCVMSGVLLVCDCSDESEGKPESRAVADAKVIAASPKMLEALRCCVEQLEAIMGGRAPANGCPADAYTVANEAIEEATT